MVTLTDAEIMAGIRVSADTAGLSGEGETAILITDNDMGALIPARAAYARVGDRRGGADRAGRSEQRGGAGR